MTSKEFWEKRIQPQLDNFINNINAKHKNNAQIEAIEFLYVEAIEIHAITHINDDGAPFEFDMIIAPSFEKNLDFMFHFTGKKLSCRKLMEWGDELINDFFIVLLKESTSINKIEYLAKLPKNAQNIIINTFGEKFLSMIALDEALLISHIKNDSPLFKLISQELKDFLL